MNCDGCWFDDLKQRVTPAKRFQEERERERKTGQVRRVGQPRKIQFNEIRSQFEFELNIIILFETTNHSN